MSFVSRVIESIGLGGSARPAETMPSKSVGASYMRGGRGVVFSKWNPALREAQSDVSESFVQAAARAVDVAHNSGWISGMIDQAVANTVGVGLSLKASPENSLFGMDDKSARLWALDVERRFGLWANNSQECDIEGRRTFGQMQAALFSHWVATGEILAELTRKRRPWNVSGTKVRLLPSRRIKADTSSMEGLVNGVYMDADGMPIAYLARKIDPLLGEVTWRVNARDSVGRARVVHVFVGAPATCRGITPMAPVLQVARQFDQLADATLTSAVLQAMFSVAITGDAPTEEIMQGLLTPAEQSKLAVENVSNVEAYMQILQGYYEGNTFDPTINGRVAHLFPGQDMEFLRAAIPGSDYKDFSKQLLRETARCLGMTYESATGDYETATYSSVRMATSEVFTITSQRREFLIAPFNREVYAAWLEDEIYEGRIPFPGGYQGFLANRAAAVRSLWRGSPKPQADDEKMSRAHATYDEMGVMSHAQIAADLGYDIEDVYAQRAAEQELRANYQIEDPSYANASKPPVEPTAPKQKVGSKKGAAL